MLAFRAHEDHLLDIIYVPRPINSGLGSFDAFYYAQVSIVYASQHPIAKYHWNHSLNIMPSFSAIGLAWQSSKVWPVLGGPFSMVASLSACTCTSTGFASFASLGRVWWLAGRWLMRSGVLSVHHGHCRGLRLVFYWECLLLPFPLRSRMRCRRGESSASGLLTMPSSGLWSVLIVIFCP